MSIFLCEKISTDVPNIDFVIILLVLNNFRRRIKRSSATSFPQERRMDSPSKIT